MNKWSTSVKSIFFCLIICMSANAEITFDIKKAVTYAIEHSHSFDTIKRQLSVSEFEKKLAKSKLFPSLDFTATHGIQDSSPRSTGPWGSELTLGLTETLYNNGQYQTNYQIAILNLRQSEYKFNELENKVCLDISLQYLVYSLNVKLQEIQEGQYKLVSKQFDLISKAYYQGINTQNDYLRIKAQIRRSEIDLLNSKNTVIKSKQELERLIGIDLKSEEIINFIPLPIESIKTEITESTIRIEDHLQYKEVQLQKEINQLNSDLIARKNLPEIYVSTGLSYGNSNYLGSDKSFSDNSQVSWNALLTIKYNLFDWGARGSEKGIAEQKNIIQRNDLESGLLELKSSLSQLDINVKQVQANYHLSKELLSLEKTNLNYIDRQYRNGNIQYLDLINGLNNLSDAQTKFYSATYDLQSSRYNLLYHRGKLYEELLK